MNSYQSAFYDILTILPIVGNLIFMSATIFWYENIYMFMIALILMFVVVGLRKSYNNKWEEQFGDIKNEK